MPDVTITVPVATAVSILQATGGDISVLQQLGVAVVSVDSAEGRGQQGLQGLQGLQGVTGSDGRTIWSGSGAPSLAVGAAGDYYIDDTAHTIYGPRTGGSWGSPTSLIGPAGPTGPTGPAGLSGAAASAYRHVQGVPSAVWTIPHMLGFRPNIQTFDSRPEPVIGDVFHVSPDLSTVTFAFAISGEAECS